MAVNTSRVVIGGLAAGLVANIVDFVGNGIIMKDAYTNALNALKPGLATQMAGGSTIATFVVLDFIIGILITLTYAWVRPRFGPGPKTAAYVGLLLWIFGGCIWAFVTAMGVFPWSMFVPGAIEALVSTLAAAYVGAMLYKEEVMA